jgi:hypothetical protein
LVGRKEAPFLLRNPLTIIEVLNCFYQKNKYKKIVPHFYFNVRNKKQSRHVRVGDKRTGAGVR